MPATALDPKTALVVIDLQKGISGYPTVHPFADVVANTRRLAEAFRRAQLPVVLVNVSFAADEGDRFRGRTEIQARAFPAPDFADLVPELGAQPSDLRITKHQPSAFYGTDLDLQLRRRRVTGVVLTGVATSIGVDTTARAAHEHAYNVTFASDAMTDVDPASHEHALKKIFPRLGEIDTTERILALLASRGA
ncbi:MAG TPA: isochorismatase family protein [Polyangia bacterium]|jgi:nicotinamidase-related amidase|nr:isochorismatase family protein [Polyangia bacterium]